MRASCLGQSPSNRVTTFAHHRVSQPSGEGEAFGFVSFRFTHDLSPKCFAPTAPKLPLQQYEILGSDGIRAHPFENGQHLGSLGDSYFRAGGSLGNRQTIER